MGRELANVLKAAPGRQSLLRRAVARMAMVATLVTAPALMAIAMQGEVLAQAGSAGGSVAPPAAKGREGKSLSGSEPAVQATPKPAKPPIRTTRQPTPPKSRAAAPAKTCRSIVGTWSSWASGSFGANDTRFNADGTISHPTSKGTWSCANGEYVHLWNLFGRRGPYRLSADGKQLIKTEDGSVSFYRNGAAPKTAEGASKPAETAAPSAAPAAQRTPLRAPAAPAATGRTGWIAVAGVWNLEGKMASGVGMGGTEAEARANAIAECEIGAADVGFGGGGCRVVHVYSKGCYFTTIGEDTNGEGHYVSGSSVKEVLGKCRSQGLTCQRPMGGCVGR